MKSSGFSVMVASAKLQSSVCVVATFTFARLRLIRAVNVALSCISRTYSIHSNLNLMLLTRSRQHRT